LPFGAGLGWREAQRPGLGTAQVPKTEKRLNRCQSSRMIVSGVSIRRVKRRILLARVLMGARAKPSARMLPNLSSAVPMKAKLRKLGCYGARLLLLKLNPNPFADNLAQFPKARGFMVEHVQNFRRRKSAIVESLPEINPMQL
jgi:hypothetical protein